jgi:hypothetical protein
MQPRFSARHLLFGSSLLVLAACADSSTSPISHESSDAAARQERAEAAFQRVSPDVMSLPNTVFADNDERIGKVVIGISNLNAAAAVRAAMERNGIGAGDYEVVLTPEIETKATLRDVFRPTVAGIQVHFGRFVCTLGSNVDHAGGRSFIINSHCTNTQGGTEGTTYAQPSRTVDPTVIATEVDDPVYVKGGAGCPKGKKCRHSDASRALYSASVASNRGEIAQTTGPNNGSLTVSTTNPIFTVLSQDNVTKSFPIGTVVNKVGRTTGWTQGQVDRTCVNTGVSGSTVFLFCQTFVVNAGGATVVGGGDSGSGVFRILSGNNVELVGLLWGGSSDNKLFVFSPLASIQQELGPVVAIR